MPWFSAVVSLLLLVGCGGLAVVDAGEGGAPPGTTSATTGGAPGVWTECSSPAGYRICHGPNDCPADQGTCGICAGDFHATEKAAISFCINDAMVAFGARQCFKCPDGGVCGVSLGELSLRLGSFNCLPIDIAQLYDAAGYGHYARYADYGLWTGDPLPSPSTCPIIEGVTLCGPGCGDCPTGELCTGRSRLHPHSFCLPEDAGSCSADGLDDCPPGEGCFKYTVEPEAQPLADQHGYCLEMDRCEALAAGYPGGGVCFVP